RRGVEQGHEHGSLRPRLIVVRVGDRLTSIQSPSHPRVRRSPEVSLTEERSELLEASFHPSVSAVSVSIARVGAGISSGLLTWGFALRSDRPDSGRSRSTRGTFLSVSSGS